MKYAICRKLKRLGFKVYSQPDGRARLFFRDNDWGRMGSREASKLANKWGNARRSWKRSFKRSFVRSRKMGLEVFE